MTTANSDEDFLDPFNTSIMYRPGKILSTGGGTGDADPVRAGAAVIDLTQPGPAWRSVAPMANKRYWHNLTLLADGTVLVPKVLRPYLGGREVISK